MNVNPEYLQRLTVELKKNNLDAIMIAPSEDMVYLMGFTPMLCERFQALFIKADGDYFYICSQLYTSEMKEHMGGKKIYSWFDNDGFLEVTHQAFTENDLLGKTIGVNISARGFNLLEIQAAMDVNWVSARFLCQEIRIRKNQSELDGMRKAAKIAEKTMNDVIAFIRPGMVEKEAKTYLFERIIANGGSNPRGLVASGPNGANCHYVSASRTIQKGDAIVIDFTLQVQGVTTDITRTVFVGQPSPKQRQVYDLVRKAQEAGEAAARNGAFIPDIEAAARRVIEDGGYGEYFITKLGHGIGYVSHEAPNIAKNNPRYLEPGMAFTIEPGIYIEGEFGVRIENSVCINLDGQTEPFHSFTKDYIILGE